jgi:arylsulfatase A-like enzyme
MYAFYDVHTPLMARDDLKTKYEAKRARLNLETQWASDSPRRSRINQDHVVYAAMVEAMDQAVGTVLSKLDQAGLTKDTIVVFTSDNGGLSTYHQTYSAPQWAPTSNTPYRAGKGWMYDGGIRVPLIYRWPSSIKAGTTTPVVSSSPDHLPTLLDLCQIKKPSGLQLDGMSLAKALQGKPTKERSVFWHYPHFWSSSLTPSSAVRSGNWKLIEWLEEGKVELFNLKQDPSESVELSQKEPKKTRELKEKLNRWRKEVGAKPLLPNPAFDPANPVGEQLPGTAR